MKLYLTPASPYARKVRMVALEAGITEPIDLIEVDLAAPPADFLAANPLGKVPALVADEGGTLFDSPVICEYLAQLGGDLTLFPPPGPARWAALRKQALGDGIMDALVLNMLELRRDEAQRSSQMMARREGQVLKALDMLDAEAAKEDSREEDGTAPTIGDISVACGLGYLDFRFPDLNWRMGRDALATWHKIFAKRAAWRETMPQNPA